MAHEVRAFLAELGLEGYPEDHRRARPPRLPARSSRAGASASAGGRCWRSAGRCSAACPDLVTTTWWRDQRDRPVFVDYNQMARDHTMTSAYSIRPTPAALVSAPLDWSELDDARPEDFDVLSMPARFAERGDPHAGLDGRRYSLEPLLELADPEGLEPPPER